MELSRINALAFLMILTVTAVSITVAFKPVGVALYVLAASKTAGTPAQFAGITTEIDAMQKMNKAILTGVNTLAVFKRNERSVDVLYGIVMSFAHKRSTSFKQDFSEANSEIT